MLYAKSMNMKFISRFSAKALRTAQSGFTMIELLVVIAVIGVLSVAVLSSINPIEQINKGRDTRARSDAAQLINASDRYFSIAEQYPWNTTTDTYTATVTDYADEFIFDETGTVAGAETDWSWTDILVTNAEIKQGFVNRLTNDDNVDYYIEKAAAGNASMYTCFRPSSNAFQDEALEACNNSNGTLPAEACPTTCTAVGGDKSLCMICLP